MSEPNDSPKQTPEEIQSRIARGKEYFRKEEAEIKRSREYLVSMCPHRDRSDNWAFNLQHNFPDRCPRGICLMCLTVIHPVMWTDGGPNQIVKVDAHPLYPVVEAVERRDHARAVLSDARNAAVDAAFYLSGDRTLSADGVLFRLERIFRNAELHIWEEFQHQTDQYKPSRKAAIQ